MLTAIRARLVELREQRELMATQYNELETTLHQLDRSLLAVHGGIQELEELERQLLAQETSKEVALVTID